MKLFPCACLICVAALSGLPLVLSAGSAPAGADASLPPASKPEIVGEGAPAASEAAPEKATNEKLSAAREARRAADLARYDLDKDGRLNADERAAKKADLEKARAEKKAAREARKTAKAAAAQARKLAKYDRNKDGKLDESELAAFKADEDRRQAAAAKRKAAKEAMKTRPAIADAEEMSPDQE
jgi:hypothetical protein